MKNINNKPYFYLTDFSESKINSENMQTTSNHTLVGTPLYFSPELFKIFQNKVPSRNFNPIKVDMYSLGIIIVEIILG